MRKSTRILVPSITAAVAALLMVAVFASQKPIIAQPSTIPAPMGDEIRPGGPMTPSEFLASGGKSVIKVVPDSDVVQGQRGTTVKATFTLSHIENATTHGIPKVSIVASGIGNGIILPSAASNTSEQDRTDAVKATGKPSGAVDLNSLVTFSPKAVVLAPGESQKVDMYITIPTDWPDELVGQDIWFGVIFGEGQSYDYRDLLIDQSGVTLHVVS